MSERLRLEPARVVSVIVAIAVAALPELRELGVLSPEWADSLGRIIAPAVVLLGGEAIRSRVSPVQG